MFTGQQIRDKRKKEGLSVAELATRLSVSEQSLYKWEKGTRPNNAQDYLKVENWLKKGLESIPENHNGKKAPNGNSGRLNLSIHSKTDKGKVIKKFLYLDYEADQGIEDFFCTAKHI